MTQEEFIKELKKREISYEVQGERIIIIGWEDVWLHSLETIPPGVEFRNSGDVYLGSILGGWFHRWNGNIEGVHYKTLLNHLIKKGAFV